jgi:hypothetical protein
MCCWLQTVAKALEALRVDSRNICMPLRDLSVEGVLAVHWQDLAEHLLVKLVDFLDSLVVWVDVRVRGLQLLYGDDHTGKTHPLQVVHEQG